ncbi:hypothetical protein [Psychroserpens sp.]|uniref:hypothetical protein n=1 Tax=Psychroserpens sp. TaxID=2020870 RepID=UPI001B027164|nr:hypothetical protein [Psychroserpens sp.]MBO6605400.1 hypothetical protein [Psychroserpens sp.]MBO6630176.1 hypothetical protein [Psychroserpens sp.]MBO6653791.1 hypothetical protein [Psychroserpens sp.]MBO6682112.1 hypothetical protein [Psychroserpens sp.]MBO6748774.1 hypothetical protein [Psychroserpens sp.]
MFSFVLILMFAIGQFFISDQFSTNSVTILFKYLFTASVIVYFERTQLPEMTSNRFARIFEIILIINCLLIFVGWVFEISFLRTYAGHRFGYNGLFLNSATGTYAYIIGLFYYLIKYKRSFFFKINSWMLILCCLLLGTKAAILGICFLLLGYVIFFLSGIQRIIAMIVGLLLSSGAFYYVFYHGKLFNSIRIKDGLWTAIFSFRNENLQELTLNYIAEQWRFINYLFGGVSDFGSRAQFGFIDEIFFFGIIGGSYYLFIHYRMIKKYLNINLFKYLLFSLCIVILLAGNYFSYPSIAVYVIAFIYIMKLEYNKESIQ